MFTSTFKKVSWAVLGLLCMLVAVTFSSCGKTYEVHASSDSFGSGDARDLKVLEIYDNKGQQVNLGKWEKIRLSGDYSAVPVASPQLRKILSSEEKH